MGKKHSTTALALLFLLSVAAVSFAQSSDQPNRRVPKLTTEDVVSAPRPVVEADGEIVPPPPPSRRPDSQPSGRGAVWHNDFVEATNLARSKNSLVVVDVYTDWCGWCKKMDREIYSDSRIREMSQQEVFLKLNAEDRGQGEEFAKDNGVHNYPTTIILDSRGQVLKATKGFISSPDAFIQMVRQARASLR